MAAKPPAAGVPKAPAAPVNSARPGAAAPAPGAALVPPPIGGAAPTPKAGPPAPGTAAAAAPAPKPGPPAPGTTAAAPALATGAAKVPPDVPGTLPGSIPIPAGFLPPPAPAPAAVPPAPGAAAVPPAPGTAALPPAPGAAAAYPAGYASAPGYPYRPPVPAAAPPPPPPAGFASKWTTRPPGAVKNPSKGSRSYDGNSLSYGSGSGSRSQSSNASRQTRRQSLKPQDTSNTEVEKKKKKKKKKKEDKNNNPFGNFWPLPGGPFNPNNPMNFATVFAGNPNQPGGSNGNGGPPPRFKKVTCIRTVRKPDPCPPVAQCQKVCCCCCQQQPNCCSVPRNVTIMNPNTQLQGRYLRGDLPYDGYRDRDRHYDDRRERRSHDRFDDRYYYDHRRRIQMGGRHSDLTTRSLREYDMQELQRMKKDRDARDGINRYFQSVRQARKYEPVVPRYDVFDSSDDFERQIQALFQSSKEDLRGLAQTLLKNRRVDNNGNQAKNVDSDEPSPPKDRRMTLLEFLPPTEEELKRIQARLEANKAPEDSGRRMSDPEKTPKPDETL